MAEKQTGLPTLLIGYKTPLMKLTVLKGTALAVIVILLGLANSSGPAASGTFRTGAPSQGGGMELTCSSCHGGGSYGTPTLDWTISATAGGPAVTSYVPGQQYFVSLQISAPSGNPAGYGFSSTFLLADLSNAGTPSNPDGDSQVTNGFNGRTYVEHNKRTADGNWDFRWTAPPAGSGTVTLYSSGNAVNGAGTGGDNAPNQSVTVVLTESTVLPVELTHFTGQRGKNGVELAWTTATETDFSHFVVERSTVGGEFWPLGRTLASGERGDRTDYTYTDRTATGGTVLYRLRMVDLDGSEAFSPIVSVSVPTAWSVYPNPATRQLNWDAVPEDAELRLLDATGRVRWAGGASNRQTDLSDLPAGVYLAEVTTAAGRSTRKVIKR